MSISRKHILLVEEHRGISSALLEWYETLHGFALHCLTSARESLGFIGRATVDAAIVDLSTHSEIHPRLQAIRTWRQTGLNFPILATSANDYDGLLVQSLEAGADDFLRKPYFFEDLHARVQRQLVRSEYTLRSAIRIDGIALPESAFSFAGATITPDLKIHFPNGETASVGTKQLGILKEFSRHQGTLLPKEKLIYAVWGADANLNSGSVHQYLHTLRKLYRKGKIELSQFVRPESKIGWRIAKEVESPAFI